MAAASQLGAASELAAQPWVLSQFQAVGAQITANMLKELEEETQKMEIRFSIMEQRIAELQQGFQDKVQAEVKTILANQAGAIDSTLVEVKRIIQGCVGLENQV